MCFCFQHHYKYITKNAVLDKFIQNKRTFQTHVFKKEARKVSLLAARTIQFICINVLYQIAGTDFSRWYKEIKKFEIKGQWYWGSSESARTSDGNNGLFLQHSRVTSWHTRSIETDAKRIRVWFLLPTPCFSVPCSDCEECENNSEKNGKPLAVKSHRAEKD